VAFREADRNRRLLYSADVHLASQVWQEDEGNVAQCDELLLAHVPGPGQPDLREFCWRYQWRLLHRDPVLRLPVVPRAAGVAADNQVATLDEAGTVTVWPIGEPNKHEAWALVRGGVRGVTLSRNGEVAAVIDGDGSATVFDVRSGRPKVQIRAPSPLVNLKLSADGRFVVGVGRDKHPRTWDAASGKELNIYRKIDATAKELDVSLDGKQLLAWVGDKDDRVLLYRAAEEKPKVLYEGGYNVLQGALSPDGKLAAVAHFGQGTHLYDTTADPDTDQAGFLPSRSPPVRVLFSPDGTQLAVGERTGLITLWRLPRRAERRKPPVEAAAPATAEAHVQTTAGQLVPRRLKGHRAAIAALAFTRDGQKLISIDVDHAARCWDMGEQEESRVLHRARECIDAVSYSPDGRYLVVASVRDGIRVHDLASTAPPRSLTRRPSRRVVVSPDGRTIAGGPDHVVTLWDAKTKDLLGTLTEPKLPERMADPKYQELIQSMGAEIGALAFSPDSRWLAVGVGGPHSYGVKTSQDVMVFDVAQRKEHRSFPTRTQVNAVAFSADGKLLAAAGHDGTIWLWDTASWVEISRWHGPPDTGYGAILFLPGSHKGEPGASATADPDHPGHLLATGSRSGRIDVWDVQSRALVRPMHGHIGLISTMVLSGDGRTLATAACDGSIKLWDGGTGRELRTLYRQLGWMYALAFSPDGNTLASGGEDRLLRLWEASSKEAVAAELVELEVPRGTRP
jgi:WD40 repeat protein